MAHNQELLAKTPIIKFRQEDFYSLRDYCLNRGLLFEDETLPAETYSIGLQLLKGKNLSSLSWMRPKDLLKGKSEPHFILEGVSSFDIQQGEAGDCWFLAALGSLTQNPQHLQKILMDQSFSYQYAGIFHFPFWQCGQWVEVEIDDHLPVLNNEYFFVNPRDKQEFWPSLLEKAYAKFHGSCVNLHCGCLPDALVDLTGGVVTIISLRSSSSDLMTVVKMVAEAGSLMTCSTLAGPTSESTRMANGLVSRHAYTVTGAEQIQYRSGWEYLIRLWNPWGKSRWRGHWSDRSLEWQETHDQRKSQLYENKDDGEFWMSCQDFRDNFCLFICNQVPISLDHGNTIHERWPQLMFKSHLIPGNAEGPQRDMQYIFSVPESMENNNVIMSFNFVMPQNLKAKDRTFPPKSEVFKIDYQFQHFRERLPSTFFSKFRIAEKGIVSETTCNLTECFSLSPGTYVVVASAGREGVEFLLRIFLKMPDSDRNLDGNLNLRPLQVSSSRNGSQRSIFYKYAQQGLDIDATQVQSLLNQEFLKGPPGDTFSLDECQSIVALTDLKVNGRLDQEEFSRLWSCLVHCQSVFQNSRKNSGVFPSSDLWKAIKDTDFLAGISVTNERLDLMRLRYSDSTGRVSFPSLVCILMRLEAMTKAFQNLAKDGKGLYLTEMESHWQQVGEKPGSVPGDAWTGQLADSREAGAATLYTA
ncbi:PREDICTED: calpain-13 [Lipotes vexillifer]|uniref:Calpain-13 n=1 Tax=Lipotes vexillifer TaxID=118797 RepID=A0A340YD85_LIPVE|nr:PREDICTED: calpain-13 [Lipotes vexillifer]